MGNRHRVLGAGEGTDFVTVNDTMVILGGGGGVESLASKEV